MIDWKSFYGLPYGAKTAIVYSSSIDNKKQYKSIEDRKKLHKHNNFEELALEYLRYNTNDRWEPTKATRDGNKDAVITFFTIDTKEESWMEAKFSYGDASTQLLSRYKIDATIVSAILNKKKIRDLHIITNRQVSIKTIQDITMALLKYKTCNTVYFTTKEEIENWLLEKKSRFEKYFDIKFEQIKKVKKGLQVIQQVSLYSDELKYNLMADVSDRLYEGRKYWAHFSIRNYDKNCKCEIIPTVHTKIEGNKKKLTLKKGRNDIKIPLSVKQIKHNKKGDITKSLFSIIKDGVEFEILLFRPLNILTADYSNIRIESHENFSKKILEYLNSFSGNNYIAPHALFVYGRRAVGKTKILNDAIRKFEEQYLYFSFADSEIDNIKLLLKMSLYLLCPFYFDFDSVNFSYLEKIDGNITILKSLKSLASICDKNNTDADIMLDFRKQISDNDFFFPIDFATWRYVVIDDVQRIAGINSENRIDYVFFRKILSGLNIFPVAFIFVGNTWFLDRSVFSNDKVNYFGYYKELEINFSLGDIMEYYINNKKNKDKTNLPYTSYEFTLKNILSDFIIFKAFIDDFSINIYNTKDFFNQLLFFQDSKIFENNLTKNFEMNMSDELKKIYFSAAPVPQDNFKSSFIEGLINLNLVKENHQGDIIPYHDKYRSIFLKHFSRGESEQIFTSQEDKWLNCLLYGQLSEKKETVNVIEKIQYSNTFTVFYILEQYFNDQRFRDNYGEGMLAENNKEHCKLYFAYAYACANHSVKNNGKQMFYKMYKVLKNSFDRELRMIAIKSQSECINAEYEDYNLQDGIKAYNEYEVAFAKYKKDFKHSNDETPTFQLNSRAYKMYIDTLNGKDTENEFEYIFTAHESDLQRAELCSRYANLLLTRNFDNAIEKIEIALSFIKKMKKENIVSIKHDEKINLQYIYYMMLKDENYTNIEIMANNARKLTFANNRRKFFLAFASIAAMHGHMALSKHLIESESINVRNENRKFRFYIAQASAVYMIKDGNISGAIKELTGILNDLKEINYFSSLIFHNLKTLQKSNFFHPLKVEIMKSIDFKDGIYYIEPRGER